MLLKLAKHLIGRAERRVGVTFDHVHHIADTDLGLLARYNRIFGFIDPNRHVPPFAYHTARLIGARSGDCGTCVQAEISLARRSGLSVDSISAVLRFDLNELPPEIAAVANLAKAVTDARGEDSEAREIVRRAYGENGLIEIAFAMSGAALLPNIKRAMGYATSCNLDMLESLNPPQ
ncbi:MAG: hypothetical protein AAF493_24820 [Pseudomonadota bacterium]